MKTMNHREYPKALRSKSIESLRFIAKDAREALRAMPDNVNAGYYADEIAYVANEIARREGVQA